MVIDGSRCTLRDDIAEGKALVAKSLVERICQYRLDVGLEERIFWGVGMILLPASGKERLAVLATFPRKVVQETYLSEQYRISRLSVGICSSQIVLRMWISTDDSL